MSDITLHPRQIEAIEAGVDPNFKIVFITGFGGSGKSTCLKEIAKKLSDDSNVIILAPTQSAADLIGGQTLHSFFKLHPNMDMDATSEKELMQFATKADMSNIAGDEKTTIIIDEISMVGKKVLNSIIKNLNVDKLILFGDPQQLKPVKDKIVNWEKIAQKTVKLTHNYRATSKTLQAKLSDYSSKAELPLEDLRSSKKSTVKELYADGYTFIAFKNDTLSKLEELCGAKCEIALLMGSAERDLVIHGTKKQYMTNNARVRLLKPIGVLSSDNSDDSLTKYTIVRLGAEGEELPSENLSSYPKQPEVWIGSHSYYNRVLEERFATVTKTRDRLVKRYGVKAKNLKEFVFGRMADREYTSHPEYAQDKADWSKVWRDYFAIKNVPFARSARFITTYKSQGRGIDKVAVMLDEMPSKDHIEVAIGRSMEDFKLICKNPDKYDFV